MEGVQGVGFGEAIGILIRRKFDEIYNLGGVITVEGSQAVVELCEARGNTVDSKLGKQNPSFICPELRELDSNSVDVEGGSGCRFGHSVEEGQVLKKKSLSIWRLEGSWYGENRDQAQTN